MRSAYIYATNDCSSFPIKITWIQITTSASAIIWQQKKHSIINHSLANEQQMKTKTNDVHRFYKLLRFGCTHHDHKQCTMQTICADAFHQINLDKFIKTTILWERKNSPRWAFFFFVVAQTMEISTFICVASAGKIQFSENEKKRIQFHRNKHLIRYIIDGSSNNNMTNVSILFFCILGIFLNDSNLAIPYCGKCRYNILYNVGYSRV